MKLLHLTSLALAVLGGMANAQSSGSDTAQRAAPNDGARWDAFTSPAIPGDPATRLPPNPPATPSPPSTPVDVPPVDAGLAKGRQDCNAVADESARKNCLMHASAGSSPTPAAPNAASDKASGNSGKSD